MLRKTLSFSGARLSALASFSSVHFKAVTLAAFLVTFASVSIYELRAEDECCTASVWSYLIAKGCTKEPNLTQCGSSNACIHCQCDRVIAFRIPVKSGTVNCNHPGTYQANNVNAADYFIYHNETNSGCQADSTLTENIAQDDHGYSQGGSNDMSDC
jgi:hypothetical protein